MQMGGEMMEYFLIETDEKNRIPYNINKNHVIDSRMLTREKINRLGMWNIVEMDLPMEAFFPDLICRPFIMVSDTILKTMLMYHPEISYRGIKLWHKESGTNASYFIPILDEIECLSEQTQYNSVGNRIVKPVLDKDRIGGAAVFRIRGFDKKCIAGRLDFVESVLRRGTGGIRMKEVEVIRDQLQPWQTCNSAEQKEVFGRYMKEKAADNETG